MTGTEGQGWGRARLWLNPGLLSRLSPAKCTSTPLCLHPLNENPLLALDRCGLKLDPTRAGAETEVRWPSPELSVTRAPGGRPEGPRV